MEVRGRGAGAVWSTRATQSRPAARGSIPLGALTFAPLLVSDLFRGASTSCQALGEWEAREADDRDGAEEPWACFTGGFLFF